MLTLSSRTTFVQDSHTTSRSHQSSLIPHGWLVFKFEVCICISMWRASKWSHFTQTFNLQHFTRKTHTWYWQLCIGYQNNMMSHYTEEAMTCTWKQLEIAHLTWPLKDVGSQYTAMYTIYMDFTKFINHIIYNYVFVTLLYTLSYVKEKMKIYSYYTLTTTLQCIYLHSSSPQPRNELECPYASKCSNRVLTKLKQFR